MTWKYSSARARVVGAAIALYVPAACGGSEGQHTITRSRALSAGIDSIFAAYVRPHHPGGVVGVVYRGEVVHLKGYGSANREWNIPWTADTRYRIASITKGFTGHAALVLEDEGRLSLDDPLHDYLTDFPVLGQPITIRQLLNMTSGLWYDEWLLPLADIRGVATLDDMYALTKRQDQFNYAPGTAYDYVDTNYRLVARVIALITGKPFHDAMTELIYGPVGMASTLNPPDLRQVFDRQATVYVKQPRDSIPYGFAFPYQTSGDGSLITTLNDLIRWILHLRQGYQEGSSIFDRLQGPVAMPDGTELPYGLGLRQVDHRGLSGWGHGGATGTFWAFFPSLDLAIAYFTNYLGEFSGSDLVGGIIDAFLASELNPEPSLLSDANPHRDEPHGMLAPLGASDAEAIVGIFVDPASGYFLASTDGPGRLGHNFIGEATFFEKVDECAYRSVVAMHVPVLRVDLEDCERGVRSDLLVRHADWGRPRRFVRVDPATAPPARGADYVGHYYTRQLRVHWKVAPAETGLQIEVGAGALPGQRFTLRPLLRDVFQAIPIPSDAVDLLALPTLAVRFERDSSGRVRRMHVATNRIRGLAFERE